MGIQRSSFYAWKKKLSNPSDRAKSLVSNVLLFQEYHLKYPSHGYRWLNTKIRLDILKFRVQFLLTTAPAHYTQEHPFSSERGCSLFLLEKTSRNHHVRVTPAFFHCRLTQKTEQKMRVGFGDSHGVKERAPSCYSPLTVSIIQRQHRYVK